MDPRIVHVLLENAALLNGIADRDARLQKYHEALRASVAARVKAAADVEGLRAQLDVATATANAAANAHAFIVEELDKKVAKLVASAAKAARAPSGPVGGAPVALTEACTSSLYERLTAGFEAALARAQLMAHPPAGPTHRTLILWDMQNVPLPPDAATVATATDYLVSLEDVARDLSGAPKESRYDLVAAFCPHNGAGDWGHVASPVVSAMNARGDLLAAGRKAGAADGILMRKLTEWLADTATRYSSRAVVFVTGDGDFAPYAKSAKDAGCAIGLLSRGAGSLSSALKAHFPCGTRRSWDAVVGKDGAAAIAALQDELTASQDRSREQAEQGVNKRPDLLKTTMCAYVTTGQQCRWLRTKGSCWYAHSEDELCVAPHRQ